MTPAQIKNILSWLDDVEFWTDREGVTIWSLFMPEPQLEELKAHLQECSQVDEKESEEEPLSLGELAADAEMETGCAPEDAVQAGIEHLIDRYHER